MLARPDCDVLIAGAGPAGAAAAIHLAHAGLDVILADFQTFPRDKTCGDFVGPVALQQLRSLGITQLFRSRYSNIIRTAAVYLDGRHLITSKIPHISGLPGCARVIRRKTLDDSMVAKARNSGAQVLEGCLVTGFQIRRDHIQVQMRCNGEPRIVKSRLLIGADGSTSVVARLLRGGSAPTDDRVIAVRGYFEDIKGAANQADLFFASESFPGYCWVFPTSKSVANVGVGMIQQTLPPDKHRLKELLLRLIQQDRALRNRLAGSKLLGKVVGWPLTTYNSSLAIVGERILLIGYAAGLINPLNGEGIQYALLSAAWAAQTVMNSAQQGNYTRKVLTAYSARVERELALDMSVARCVVQLIRNRSLNPVWLQALRVMVSRAQVDPEYAHTMGAVLAGLIPARSALTLEIIGKTVQQAAVSLGLTTAMEALRGPKHLVQAGVMASGAAIGMMSTMRQHHAASVKWGVDLITSALELTRGASALDGQIRKSRVGPGLRPKTPSANA